MLNFKHFKYNIIIFFQFFNYNNNNISSFSAVKIIKLEKLEEFFSNFSILIYFRTEIFIEFHIFSYFNIIYQSISIFLCPFKTK